MFDRYEQTKDRMNNVSRISGVPALLALLVSSSALAAETIAVVIDDPVYTHAQQLVEIEPGRKLNFYCLGTGEPTVVFDSGLADETSAWGLVQPVIAGKTRACSYDRAGIGFSDPGKRPGTSANIVDDLHRLLVAAAIKPPYVLVGHSYGGMNIKLYADTYPSEVVGMVFVDPSHEGQADGYRKIRHLSRAEWDRRNEPDLAERRECIAQAPAGFVPGTQLYKQCSFPRDPRFSDAIWTAHSKIYMQPGFQQALLGEEESVFGISADQGRAARRSFGDMALIVLTSSPRTGPLGSDETQAIRDAKSRLWVDLHGDIARLSTRGVNRIIADSGHNIASDQPKAVNEAILEVLEASRE